MSLGDIVYDESLVKTLLIHFTGQFFLRRKDAPDVRSSLVRGVYGRRRDPGHERHRSSDGTGRSDFRRTCLSVESPSSFRHRNRAPRSRPVPGVELFGTTSLLFASVCLLLFR